MKTADQIEREIHTKFAEQVYVGMSTTDYHSALAHVIVRYVAEQMATPSTPCVYEARPYGPSPFNHVQPNMQTGAWCKTHGWHCPANTVDGQQRDSG